MRIVDDVVLPRIETAMLHTPEHPTVHDGGAQTDPPLVDGGPRVVSYKLPYAVYFSSVGDDDNPRLAGRKLRRSVFWSIHYVGIDRNQAKWAGERIRLALQGRRVAVEGCKTWPIDLQVSTRIRRDDDAIRPDGSPLFYGVDEYAMSITLNNILEGATP